MDADANVNAKANADAGGSTIALRELCSGELKMTMRPAKTQISLGICPVWLESSLPAWRKLGSLATHLAQNKDSDQTELSMLILSFR